MNSIRLYVLHLLFLSSLARAGELPRVAVVPTSSDPSLEAFADFLTTSLASASSQYEVVERAEWNKIAAETEIQKLSADQGSGAIAKLAKADGLIIVGRDRTDLSMPKVTLRLTSTNNGLILRSLSLGGKDSDYPKAAELAAGVLRFPCEHLFHGNAKQPVIISLLGIRPAFQTDRSIETTLNLAVAQQLSAQSGIAVAERWRMNDLVFERSLADQKQSPLATGTILLDGSYERKDDQLEFTLRLRKSESEQGKKLSLKGSSNKPMELAGAIAKLVATESGQNGNPIAWNALEEGKQYADLGWWLLSRKLGEESAQAFETAVALGVGLGFVPRGRVWSYQRIFDSDEGLTLARTDVGEWDYLSKRKFNHLVRMAVRMSEVSLEESDGKWGGATLGEFPFESRKITLEKSLELNLKVLQALYLRKEQLELATEASTLRALCRSLVSRGKTEIKRNYQFQIVQTLYMHETPEQAAEEFRRLLLPENMTGNDRDNGMIMRYMLWLTYHNPRLWRFVDWSSTDNRRGEAAWMAFIGELRSSGRLTDRMDGLVLAFQTSKDPAAQAEILESCCSLMEENIAEMMTPQGQMALYSFYGFYDRKDKTQFPAFELHLAKILNRIAETSEWMSAPVIELMKSSITNWCAQNIRGRTMIPEALALQMLDSIEKYVERSNSDKNWQSLHPEGNRKSLSTLCGRIIESYPRIKERRIISRPVEAGSIAIRAWKPELPGASDMTIGMNCSQMISSGDSLFVPCLGFGILELNARTLSVSRVLRMPVPRAQLIGGLAKNGTSLMINLDSRLFVTPLSGDGKSWKEITLPDVRRDDPFNWRIDSLGEDIFVGLNMMEELPDSPRMLAGICQGEKLTWLASSNRRPATNPLDNMDPRNSRLAYRNAAGKTIVLLEHPRDRTSLVELETGRQLAELCPIGKVTTRGEMPLFWIFNKNEIDILAALDPGREQPRLLFNNPHKVHKMPAAWNNVRPAYDGKRPEFLGTSIAAIIHDGGLWLLKRDADIPGKSEPNDPQAFRLVRMGLDGGEPVVIPLRYDVPESIRELDGKMQANMREPDSNHISLSSTPTNDVVETIRALGEDNQTSLRKPIINHLSLTSTPTGLFFAPCGHEYGDTFYHKNGVPTGGVPAPVLLYITWNDINTWIAKNATKPAPSP